MKKRFGFLLKAFFIIEILKTFYQFLLYKQPRVLRAEKIKYFDSEYQNAIIESIINVDKYIYYRDVFIFVDRLKNLII